jgi:hypothetical protein
LLRFDEGRSFPTHNPAFGIGRPLADQWRDDPSDAAEFHLHDVADQKRILPARALLMSSFIYSFELDAKRRELIRWL